MKEKLEQIEKELEAVQYVLIAIKADLNLMAQELEAQEDDLK